MGGNEKNKGVIMLTISRSFRFAFVYRLTFQGLPITQNSLFMETPAGGSTKLHRIWVGFGSYKSRLARAPRSGVLAYDPTTANTNFLRFQNGKWYHWAAGPVILSTLARSVPREVHSIAILARFTNCFTPCHPPRAIM